MSSSTIGINPEAGTSALDNSFLETVVLHNRDYQQYSINNQWLRRASLIRPPLKEEVERLQIVHNVLNLVFDGRLLFPPLTRPRRILDLGYGSASWAIEVAEQNERADVQMTGLVQRVGLCHKEGCRKGCWSMEGTNFKCQVLGVDINPWQPEEVPRNLYLQVDDLNRTQVASLPHTFDLVHSRMMASGIHVNRWRDYVRDMFRVTRPGGWSQMVELYFNVQSDNGSLSDDHALRQWSTRYMESLEGLKDLRVPLRLPNMMRDAGFVDVEHRMVMLHTCAWSTDPREREIGAANRENVQRFLSSMAIYPFTERLGMTIQDVHLLVAQARLEADNPAFKVL
ncbi:Secondary metabolism regulator laeA [Lachnellula arida]|uniref:Secondary metabolism regulator laeA n=1 Tax=Lachnellula arida TaxID=1316785 RepID=A0A8T9BE52_9HELO|nr:Secondary metabolism regulator laeA [Lachnellula arida]